MNSGKTRCFHDNRFKRRALSEIATQDCFFQCQGKEYMHMCNDFMKQRLNHDNEMHFTDM